MGGHTVYGKVGVLGWVDTLYMVRSWDGWTHCIWEGRGLGMGGHTVYGKVLGWVDTLYMVR